MNKINKIKDFIEKEELGLYYQDKTFSEVTTIKTGGKIALLFYPKSLEAFLTFYNYFKSYNKYQIPLFILGCGSNVLASDQDYLGVVICFRKMKACIEINEYDNDKLVKVTVNAGCTSKKLSDFLLEHEISGGEAMSTIPGTIGGLITMNASCYDFCVKNCVLRCLCLDKDGYKWYSNEEMQFSYRHSAVSDLNLIVMKVEFLFPKGCKEVIEEKQKQIKNMRKGTQPISYASAGCAFKNTSSELAWKLIDDAGLRGFTYQKAQVSTIHPNFIINLGKAKSVDIYFLMRYVQEEVNKNFGVLLENEWVIINF